MSISRKAEYEIYHKKKIAIIKSEQQRFKNVVLPESYTLEQCNEILDSGLHIKNDSYVACIQCLCENEDLGREMFSAYALLVKALKKIAGTIHQRVLKTEPNNLELLVTAELNIAILALNKIHFFPTALSEIVKNDGRFTSVEDHYIRILDHAKPLSSASDAKKRALNMVQTFFQTKSKYTALYRYNFASVQLASVDNGMENPSDTLKEAEKFFKEAATGIYDILRPKMTEKLNKINQLQNPSINISPPILSPKPSKAPYTFLSTIQITSQLKIQNTSGLDSAEIQARALCNFYHITKVAIVPDSKDDNFEYVLCLDIDETLVTDGSNGSRIEIIEEKKLIEFLQQLPKTVKVVAVTSRMYPESATPAALDVIKEIETRVNQKNLFSVIFYTSAYPKTPVLHHLHESYIRPQYPDAPKESKKRVGLVDDVLVRNVLAARHDGFTGIHVIQGKSAHITQMYRFAKLPLPPKNKAQNATPTNPVTPPKMII